MSNFTIEFSYPWLLLALIPALALALFMHFRLDKKHRRNRNRIISLVLHVTVAVLCVAVLSGMTFHYDTGDVSNEVLIVTDYSYSGNGKEDVKAEFVRSVIEESDENYKVGVVTFGYNQVYAAPLDNDTRKVYDNFVKAERPDDSATDIASALTFARELITNPETAQIVLISDGIQTDKNALDVIRAIAADGVRVSTTCFPNASAKNEAQVDGVVMPDVTPAVDEAFRLGVSVNSSVAGNASIFLKDNDKEPVKTDIVLEQSKRDYYIDCKFDVGGLHVLKIELSLEADDGTENNNTYYTYVNVESFNKVLIVERAEGESEVLRTILTEDEQFDVEVVNIGSEKLPGTVTELRAYDQVILNNISNADMFGIDNSDKFIENLNAYVKEFGGGLFTVGGDKEDEYGRTVANTYVEDDMAGTLYQQMLPVQAIEYTPPVAVMLIIDKSGSMEGERMAAAKEGARAAIRALTTRDYCGIMTLTNDFNVEIGLTRVSQFELLYKAIDNITVGGGTYYTASIERAGRILSVENRVERKHIILVSDGLPGDDTYADAIKRNYDNYGITFSMIAIDIGNTDTSKLKDATENNGHGRFYVVNDIELLVDQMREELNVDEIKSVNHEDFVPRLTPGSNVVSGIDQLYVPKLGGFYGTREKEGVEVPLNGKYVPIFAQWSYGEGKVGSFMCELAGGAWSASFVNDDVGKQLIKNIVAALMPTGNIHAQDIEIGFEEDNYTTSISVYTQMQDGETLRVEVNEITEQGTVGDKIETPIYRDGYSRIRAVITKPGVYMITVTKLDAQGNAVVGANGNVVCARAYRAFSYSAEYDMFYDAEEGKELMTELAVLGGGQVLDVDDAWSLFRDPVTAIHHTVDPRLAFIITAIVLFLLDVAVRKFKFKWIHELVRERKENGAKQER